ncbi:MAG: HEAT repeat domain-containing protein, partial [Acidobacteria bacterium]|nr:HEAT repeat domain-containing protein [Acidobacteriota bacterium]
VKSLGDNKAYAELTKMALHHPDAELRRLAAIRITEMEGDGSTDAMVELYNKTDDPEVKQMVIDTLGRISEIEPLTKIALSDPSPELRERALYRIKWLKETGDSADIKAWYVPELQNQLNQLQDQPPAPPPPPPPPPSSAEMTVYFGKSLTPLRWHRKKDSVFALLREAADANIRHDTSFFERVLDEDYIGIGLDGETRTRAEEIAAVKRLDYAIKKFEFDDLRVSGNEGMAFATFLGTVYYEANGQDSTMQFRYTMNFIERDGQLKIVAIHVSRKS